MRADLHVHTIYSPDSLLTPTSALRWAARHGIDCLAITDHNTTEGARIAQATASMPIIIGEEILTGQGEIIGLFLQEQIPAGLTPRETVRCIHAQGGLAYIPHPMDELRHSTLAPQALLDIADEIDLIEVLNARVTRLRDNERALAFAREHALPMGAGSDAHQGFEIGRAWVDLPPFDDASSFLAGVRQGQIGGRVSSPLVHMGSACARMAKELIGIATPDR